MVLAPALFLHAEDGHKLWLRYAQLVQPPTIKFFYLNDDSTTGHVIAEEIKRGLSDLSGYPVSQTSDPKNAQLIIGTPDNLELLREPSWKKNFSHLGPEGFLLKREGFSFLVAAKTSLGCLYGAFRLLELFSQDKDLEGDGVLESPLIHRRLLDHWDNLDGTIERGYAGKSLWKWNELPGHVNERVLDYARACASVGINGTVLNNVNADPRILTLPYLKKVQALADAMRPYGLKVYLSANFGAPKALGDLPTADPFDPQVRKWWEAKASEIHGLIPDFGGFLVKANSEGQPGPLDYGRTHADGANLLADALAPYGGVVIWRAFVYKDSIDPDRIKRAYKELMPLDGKFRKNVIIQSKNGPLDFQPREPFHPLFGGLKRTHLGAELQVTQEYLGHSNHLVYLGTMWEEFFGSDTFAHGPGSTIEKLLARDRDSLMAGVANTGDDRDWCGNPFSPANWYAFGRLAWDPTLKSRDIAEEWTRMTWTRDPQAAPAITDLLMGSRDTYIDYTCPLGLAGVFEKDLHYAPDPGMVDPRHDDWSAAYYNRADAKGIGFDRTRRGSDGVDQYHAPLNDRFNGLKTCPLDYLLWFHHAKWDQRLSTGRTLWDELVFRYGQGRKEAEAMKAQWQGLRGKVDDERFGKAERKLEIQAREADVWGKKCLGYFGSFRK
ncbi:MAG TPA: alpha-glucuronidase family glycosyl hydrolase [bacterium]|nr:alpha-glucuronidase family glycosyl hydrolase [bacterium]